MDNGQHLLMGAYTHTLALMSTVGVDTNAVLKDIPLDLRWPDGTGLLLPERAATHRIGSHWATGLAMLRARGWGWRERLALVRWAGHWRRRHFSCPPDWTVDRLCASLPPRVREQLITPLCVSALNLAPEHASAQLMLTALQDTVFGAPAHSRALVPCVPLGEVFPEAAVRWLRQRGADVLMGTRATALAQTGHHLEINHTHAVDHVIVATPAPEAARLADTLHHAQAVDWAAQARQVKHTAIATVYAKAPNWVLSSPMQALQARTRLDAQFVFDLGHLGRPPGWMAAIVSDAMGDTHQLQQHVQTQLRQALSLPQLQAHQTVMEKRATFAATPDAVRPSTTIAPGVWACGDYVQGRYPATLEGAVRSATGLPWATLSL